MYQNLSNAIPEIALLNKSDFPSMVIYADEALKKEINHPIYIVTDSTIAAVLPALRNAFDEITTGQLLTLLESGKLKGINHRLTIRPSKAKENYFNISPILEPKLGYFLLSVEKKVPQHRNLDFGLWCEDARKNYAFSENLFCGAIKKEIQKKSLSVNITTSEKSITNPEQDLKERVSFDLKLTKLQRLLAAINAGTWKLDILSGPDSVTWESLNIQK